MTQSEDSIVRSIMRHLNRTKRCWVFKVHGGPFQLAGIPDILCLCRGVFIAFEVKNDNGKTTAIQEYVMKKIREAGGYTFVVRSKDEAVFAMNELMTDLDSYPHI